MIFKTNLPKSKKWPPVVARQLSKITLLGPAQEGRPSLTITTWGSVKEAPSGGITWHARVDVSLPDRYGSAYSAAGGCGYCKESTATVCALRELLADIPEDMPSPGSGMPSLLRWLSQQGWRTAWDILHDMDRAG